MIDHSEALEDFADTAALLSQMDLVISVDTALVHLAGAMARPVWTMLPLGADYRWLMHRSDSPWYPTMRLFRQPRLKDWAAVVADVAPRSMPWGHERLHRADGQQALERIWRGVTPKPNRWPNTVSPPMPTWRANLYLLGQAQYG